MTFKKHNKTKFDYQARTLGGCVILLLSFTFMFVVPAIAELKQENTAIMASMEKLSSNEDIAVENIGVSK